MRTPIMLRTQVIQDCKQVRMQAGQPLEAVLTSGLQHPNVLGVLDHAWQGMPPCSPHVSNVTALTSHLG